MPRLSVNVDHIATLRQARLGQEPDPVTAAHLAELAGAAGIIVHLREDRRHIQDHDVEQLRASIKTRLHLEMAATEEMRQIALRVRPDTICLVPEKRQELTTEGGLHVTGREAELEGYLAPLKDAGIPASLFVDPDTEQIQSAALVGAHYVELHTGAYADAPDDDARKRELERLLEGIAMAHERGLVVNLGHGLDYENIYAFREVSGIHEFSIGHSIIAQAVLVGLGEAVSRMAAIVASFADGPSDTENTPAAPPQGA